MAEGGIAAALAGPGTETAVQAAGNEEGQEQNSTSIIPAPGNLSGLWQWATGIGMGRSLADSFLEKFPELAGTEEEEEALSSLMQSIMNEVTKSLAKSTDFLKELDDDEEKCAATSIYNQ